MMESDHEEYKVYQIKIENMNRKSIIRINKSNR